MDKDLENEFERRRQECLYLILESDHRFKIVVAGAGTGKTYTFKQMLLRNPGENVVLTFINNLANDMAKDLGDLAEVRTFHSYCRKLLHKLPSEGINSNFYFFPKLDQVVLSDSEVFYSKVQGNKSLPTDIYQKAFQSLIENDGRIEFFLQRANYYNAVGFDDSVYRVLCCFRKNPNVIPTLNQLILDEYQDFNALEVEFINLMEGKNPTLIVGDDDQAIYDFRYASPSYLRKKANSPNFKRFNLPFCSRCTEVIVHATNTAIQKANTLGLLAERVEKDYICYLPDKKNDSQNYPRIVHAECSTHNSRSPYISMYIERAIRQIPIEEVKQSLAEGYPLALVAGPSHYLRQIYDYLKDKFPNVIYQTSPDMSLVPLDGYMCLMKDDMSNLGWRVILGTKAPELLPRILKQNTETNIIELIDDGFRQEHQRRLQKLHTLIQGENSLTLPEIKELEVYFEMPCEKIIRYINGTTQQDSEDITTALDCDELFHNDNPVVRLTTYNGCKGLSAGFTFITGLEEGTFPKHNYGLTDTEICQFIVAMTRTRKECHLVSTRNFAGNWTRPSVFLGWIPCDIRTSITVNKDYFSNPISAANPGTPY